MARLWTMPCILRQPRFCASFDIRQTCREGRLIENRLATVTTFPESPGAAILAVGLSGDRFDQTPHEPRDARQAHTHFGQSLWIGSDHLQFDVGWLGGISVDIVKLKAENDGWPHLSTVNWRTCTHAMTRRRSRSINCQNSRQPDIRRPTSIFYQFEKFQTRMSSVLGLGSKVLLEETLKLPHLPWKNAGVRFAVAYLTA